MNVTKNSIPTAILGTALMVGALVATPTHAAHENMSASAANNASVASILAEIVTVLTALQVDAGEPTTETAAADLRVTLNSLLREHVNLGMIALYNVIDNDDATAASVEVLDENTVELAATIGSVYGEDAEDTFRKLWRDHIGFFANYATGLRTNDADLREEAEEDLEGYQINIAAFFNGALPNIDEATVRAGAGEHKDLLLEAMEEYHDGDYEAAYEAQREADKQISGIANLLAKEIVKQNPELF